MPYKVEITIYWQSEDENAPKIQALPVLLGDGTDVFDAVQCAIDNATHNIPFLMGIGLQVDAASLGEE